MNKKKTIIYILCVALCTTLLLHTVLAVSLVRGTSNEPTLHDGDLILVNTLAFRTRQPERFEMITFHAPDGKDLIKRVIGLPGETVTIDYNGCIYIDGNLLEETYGKEKILDPGRAMYGVTLADDEYFVLGDNRNDSIDSRAEDVGNVRLSSITGKPYLVLFPFSRFATAI